MVGLAGRVVVSRDHSVLATIERRVAAGQHRLDPGRDLHPLRSQAVHGPRHAQRVPGLERAQLPQEAPATGPIDRQEVVADLRNALGGVHDQPRQDVPQVGTAAVFGERQLRHALADVFRPSRSLQAGEGGLLWRPVLEGLQIERPELTPGFGLDLLVEADVGLVAQPAALDHRADQGAGPLVDQYVPVRIIRDRRVQVLRNVRQHVQPHQVVEPEGCRLRPADRRSGQGVDLLDRVPLGDGAVDADRPGDREDAVGDEVGRVLAQHHALPQPVFAETAQTIDHRRGGVGSGNHLQKLQIARRIEEVGPQKVFPEFRRAALGDGRHRDPAGVGADDCPGPADLLDPLHQSAFDVEAFDHGLDHPLGFADLREIVFQVADADHPGQVGVVQVGRTRLEAAFEPLTRDPVAHLRRIERQPAPGFVGGRFTGDDVQQEGGHAGIGQVRRDRRSHGPCAEDGGLLDSHCHHETSFT